VLRLLGPLPAATVTAAVAAAFAAATLAAALAAAALAVAVAAAALAAATAAAGRVRRRRRVAPDHRLRHRGGSLQQRGRHAHRPDRGYWWVPRGPRRHVDGLQQVQRGAAGAHLQRRRLDHRRDHQLHQQLRFH
jgi:hypothetical protein